MSSVKERLLSLLSDKEDKFLSGAEAAKKLDVSRAAVWKAVTSLRKDGYDIDAVTNRGYRISAGDALSAEKITESLGGLADRLKIEVRSSVSSTNALLKERAAEGAPEGTVLIASEQTAGRGRFSRRFYSPAGSGVYMSILLRPDIPCESAVLITTAAAVAAAEAAEALSGKSAGIKWVNDVLIGGKKICGILTEASVNIESGVFDYAVVGIGINAYAPKEGFPPEISETAAAVFEKRRNGLMSQLAAEVIGRFFKYYDKIGSRECLDAYRKRCISAGKNITVFSAGKPRPALALDIDNSYRLHVKYPDNSEEYLTSGEISIKFL